MASPIKARAHSGYLANLLSHRANDHIDVMVETLKDAGMLTYTDAFVGTGVSGTVAASKLAYATKRELIVVRKESELNVIKSGPILSRNSHAEMQVEGALDVNYVFVDDCICSGDTLKRVVQAIQGRGVESSDKSKLVGILLYGAYEPCDEKYAVNRVIKQDEIPAYMKWYYEEWARCDTEPL